MLVRALDFALLLYGKVLYFHKALMNMHML